MTRMGGLAERCRQNRELGNHHLHEVEEEQVPDSAHGKGQSLLCMQTAG